MEVQGSGFRVCIRGLGFRVELAVGNMSRAEHPTKNMSAWYEGSLEDRAQWNRR